MWKFVARKRRPIREMIYFDFDFDFIDDTKDFTIDFNKP